MKMTNLADFGLPAVPSPRKAKKVEKTSSYRSVKFDWPDLDDLRFGPKKVVEKYEKTVREALIPEGWYDFYRENKAELKAMGYSMSEYRGLWSITLWEPIVKDGFTKLMEKLWQYIQEHAEEIQDYLASTTNANLVPLFDYQKSHAAKLLDSITRNHYAHDGSSTGTGKTFVACVVARELDMDLLVICPQRVVTDWTKTATVVGARLLGTANYSLARRGKMRVQAGTYKSGANKGFVKWTSEECPWITAEKNMNRQTKWDPKYIFTFNVSEQVLIVFDEAHRCKNRNTQNAWLLKGAKESPGAVLLCTATLASSPLDMDATGYALGLHKSKWDFFNWISDRGCHKGDFGWVFDNHTERMKQIHDEIYGAGKGSRMDKKILVERGLFPATQVHVNAYDLGDSTGKINAAYTRRIREIREKRDEYEAQMRHLQVRQKCRQEVEIFKLPLFVDKAIDLVQSGHSVVIFVNFKDTVNAIVDEITKIHKKSEKDDPDFYRLVDPDCIITGDVPNPIREARQEAFRQNKTALLVCTIPAASEAISLHDVEGSRERITLINPDDSAQGIIQVLGRVQRAGGTFSQQYLIYAAGTVEERVCDNVRGKIEHLDTLNDGDTDPEGFL